MKYINTHTEDILDHKLKVGRNMLKLASIISERALVHDDSKFSEAEFAAYSEAVPKLNSLKYGTPEHKAVLNSIRPAIEHHKANNSHHPEYFEKGVMDMDIIDFIEMVCDWKGAIERNPDTDVRAAISGNCHKFKMPEHQKKLALSIFDVLENSND